MTSGPAGDRVSVALAAELAGTPWDLPPALYLISLQEGRCELRPFPVPGGAWHTLPMDLVIVAVAGSLAGSDCPPGPSVIGAALRYEAWELPWGLLQGPARDQAMADHAGRRVHTRPDRIERRYIFAAGRDGTSWEAAQYRRQPLPRAVPYPAGTPRPRDRSSAYGALRFFARTVLGPQGPARDA